MKNYLDMEVGQVAWITPHLPVTRVQGGLMFGNKSSVFVPHDIAATDYANMVKAENVPDGPPVRDMP